MAEIHKIKKDGKTVFPVTTTKAVVDEEAKKTLNEILGEKVDKTSITQELGENEKLVLSQKGAKNLLQTRNEKDAAGGYAGLDDEGKMDNRQVRRTNGYLASNTASYITVPYGPSRPNFAEDWTIQMIVSDALSATSLFSVGDTTINGFWAYIHTTGGISFTYADGTQHAQTIASLNVFGKPFMLTLSKHGNKLECYVDDTLSGTAQVNILNTVASLIIGRITSSDKMNASISMFRMFNRSFNQSDVDYYYNNNQPDKARLLYSDTNIVTTELFSGGDFESGLKGSRGDSSGTVSTWSLNTVNPISGSQDGRLEVTTGSTSDPFVPYLSFPMSLKSGLKYKVSFKYKLNAGIIDNKIRVWNGYSRLLLETLNDYIKTSETISFTLDMVYDYSLLLYFETINNNLIDIQIDDISVKQIGSVLEFLPENATPSTWLGTQQVINGMTSGSPALNYGNFYKKPEIKYRESFFEFLLSGSGGGAAYIRVRTNTTQVATIEGGYFVNSFGDLNNIGTQKTCSAGMLTYLYFKANKASGVIRIKDVSQMAYADRISDGPTMYSRSSNLPAQELFSGGGVVYAVSGNILMLPRTLTNLVLPSSAVALNGDLLDLPRGLTELTIKGTGEINGKILDLPKLLTILQLESTNTKITGNIKELPTNIKYLVITGINTLTGDIGLCECDFEFIYLTGLNTITYVNRSNIFKSSFSGLTWRPASAGILTSDMVDNLFIDMNTYITTAIGAKAIDFRGFCAAPTAASLTARTELAAKGFTIYIN